MIAIITCGWWQPMPAWSARRDALSTGLWWCCGPSRRKRRLNPLPSRIPSQRAFKRFLGSIPAFGWDWKLDAVLGVVVAHHFVKGFLHRFVGAALAALAGKHFLEREYHLRLE